MLKLKSIFLMFLVIFCLGCSGGGPVIPGNEDNDPPYWLTAGIVGADSGNEQVTVRWGEAVDTKTPPVRYLLYMDTDINPFDQTPVIVLTNDPYVFMGLTNGREYWFGVRCMDSAMPPNIDTNTVTWKQTPWDPGPDYEPPVWMGSIGIWYVTPGDREATVYWTEALDQFNPPVKYLVYMDTDSNPFDQTPIEVTGATQYTFTDLTNGTEYWFGVRTKDSAVPPNTDTNTNTVPKRPYNYGWVHTWDTENDLHLYGIAVDSNDDVYLCGTFYGILDFDPSDGEDIHQSNGMYNQDAYLMKLDSDGNYIWGLSWGGESFEVADSVTIDDAGNPIVAGTFYKGSTDVDFDPSAGEDLHASNGHYDVFISKFNPDGVFQWAKTIGGSNSDYVYAVDSDSSGNILLSGAFFGSVDFDPGAGEDIHHSTGSSDFCDAYVTKLDQNGNYLWTNTLGGQILDYGWAVKAVDNSIYFCGDFAGDAVDLDPGVGEDLHTSSGYGDGFLISYDTSGNFVWSYTTDQEITAIDADSLGYLYCESGGNVFRISNTGILDWSRNFTSDEHVLVLAVDNNNDVVIAGDGFWKYDSDGNYIWSREFSTDFGLIACDSVNDIYLGGDYFNRFVYSSAGERGLAIPAYSPDTNFFLMKTGSDGFM